MTGQDDRGRRFGRSGRIWRTANLAGVTQSQFFIPGPLRGANRPVTGTSFATYPNISSRRRNHSFQRTLYTYPASHKHVGLFVARPQPIPHRSDLSAEYTPPPRGLGRLLRHRHHGFPRARFTYCADAECVRMAPRLRARFSFGWRRVGRFGGRVDEDWVDTVGTVWLVGGCSWRTIRLAQGEDDSADAMTDDSAGTGGGRFG